MTQSGNHLAFLWGCPGLIQWILDPRRNTNNNFSFGVDKCSGYGCGIFERSSRNRWRARFASCSLLHFRNTELSMTSQPTYRWMKSASMSIGFSLSDFIGFDSWCGPFLGVQHFYAIFLVEIHEISSLRCQQTGYACRISMEAESMPFTDFSMVSEESGWKTIHIECKALCAI